MSRTSFIITIGVALITTIVLVFVQVVTIKQTTNDLHGFLVKGQRAGVIQVFHVEDPWSAKLEAEFQSELNRALLIGTVLGAVLSVFAGLLLSSIAVAPLKKLKSGIKNLRDNNYNTKLNFVGDNDFDQVIDEFNKLTSQLEYVEKLRSDLVSDVAHELKTPLTGIIGQVEGIQDGVFKPTKKRIGLIKDQVDRLTDLVTRLQEYTHLRSRVFRLQSSNFNLGRLVEKIILSYQDRFREKSIDVETDIPKDMSLKADRDLVERVISNLMDNTLKYAKASKIKISADSSSISFSDDGEGIATEFQKYIFERFFRVEKSRSRETGGLGLGLAIVKEIIEAHGWTIEVKSPIEHDRGTQFIIQLRP